MVLVGSDDGVYSVRTDAPRTARVEQRLTSDRVERLRRFDGVEGVFAATDDGLYHAPGGVEWTDLAVPEASVYAIGCDTDRGRLYAGTRPARVYTADAVRSDGTVETEPAWQELTGVRQLPSRESWRLPRHDNLAQVRDVAHDGDRLVFGVEVGGVVVRDDGTYRETDVHEDVHELHVLASGEYVVATGDGWYQTTDAGRTWRRLDEEHRQNYFRRVYAIDDTVYGAGALANSTTWNDPDAEPALYALTDGSVTRLRLPRPETVTGMATLDGSLVVATHLGSVFHRAGDDWRELPSVPVQHGRLTGRYTPVTTDE